FSVLIPRPPSSPLFPYTTLFRSSAVFPASGFILIKNREVIYAEECVGCGAPGGRSDRFCSDQVRVPPNLELGHGWSAADRLQRRSEEHTSELQSRGHLVCRLLLE